MSHMTVSEARGHSGLYADHVLERVAELRVNRSDG